MYNVNRKMFVNFFGFGYGFFYIVFIIILKIGEIWRVKFLLILYLEIKWIVFMRVIFKMKFIIIVEYLELCIDCFMFDKFLWVFLFV